jgi:hypothetical protein
MDSGHRAYSSMPALLSLVTLSALPLCAHTSGTLEGTVRDADTANPLPDVRITVNGTSLSNRTDEEGLYFILEVWRAATTSPLS